MPHHLFVVEDHALMRSMMAEFVEAQTGIHVCDSASTAEEALDRLPGRADFVLVDISLPVMSGIDLIREVSDRWPRIRCLACSAHNEASYVARALDAGATGYVAKGNPSELTAAIACLSRGEQYVSPSLSADVEAAFDASDDDEPMDGCGPITLDPDAAGT